MDKKKLCAQYIIDLLCKEDKIITLEQAALIVEFLRKMARHSVNGYLTDKKPSKSKIYNNVK